MNTLCHPAEIWIYLMGQKTGIFGFLFVCLIVTGSCAVAQVVAQWHDMGTATLTSQAQGILPSQPPKWVRLWAYTTMPC